MSERIIIHEGQRYRPLTVKELNFYLKWRGDAQVIVRIPQLINGEWYYWEGPAGGTNVTETKK